jgi:hypothetical protein
VKLRCPACGSRGEAHFSLACGYALRDPSTLVESISDGFKVVPGKSWVADNIDCGECNVPSIIKNDRQASGTPTVKF